MSLKSDGTPCHPLVLVGDIIHAFAWCLTAVAAIRRPSTSAARPRKLQLVDMVRQMAAS
jgi:hypothetical protein